MFLNYIKVAYRNLVKFKLYSLINIVGLAIGLSCSIIIFLFVQYELSFDDFHTKQDRIYRISQSYLEEGEWRPWVRAKAPVALLLPEEIPQVEESAIISGEDFMAFVKFNTNEFLEKRFAHVNKGFFDVFDFEIALGDPKVSFEKPFTLFISETMSEKYFKGMNPIGQSLIINTKQEYTVEGVFKDFPANSHVQFDFLASYQTMIQQGKVSASIWNRGAPMIYALLHENSDAESFKEQLDVFTEKYYSGISGGIGSFEKQQFKLISTPLSDIHLYANFDKEQLPQGDIRYIYLFASIALLILIIGGINYVNLSTAKALNRAKEVGVRKTSGASKSSLIYQYLGESALTVLIALLLSFFLVELCLPLFKNLLSRPLSLNQNIGSIVLIYLILWLVTSFFAGLYPAFFLSKFKPIAALKGGIIPNTKAYLRKSLVVFQLSIAIILLLTTIVIQGQMNLIQEMNPGFDDEQVLMIPKTHLAKDKFDVLKQEFEALPGVLSASTSSYEPGMAGGIAVVGGSRIEGVDPSTSLLGEVWYTGADFDQTFGLKIMKGNPFDVAIDAALDRSIMLNETAVQSLGWEDPIGKQIEFKGKERKVVGVVQDFPTASIKDKIMPLIIFPDNSLGRLFAIRVVPTNLQATITQIEAIWKNLFPEIPFSYEFLDDKVNALYVYERNLASVLTLFCFLAIIVACLGLVGLITFSTQQRTKEIGIRKVLGATVNDIVLLITKDVFKWYVTALVIGVPIAYYIANRWLQNFEYAVSLDIKTMIMVVALSVVFVLVSISYQSIKTALANPADKLRVE